MLGRAGATASCLYTSSESYYTVTGLLETATSFSGSFGTTDGYNAAGYLAQITDANTGTTYWTAQTVDAETHLTEETAGSGSGKVTTTRSFDPLTGNLQTVTAGTDADFDNLADLSYGWDSLGNLTNRTDTLQSYDENFCYDNLNRISYYAVADGGGGACNSGTIQKSIGYDNGAVGDGNITTKSDIGGYSYGQNGAGPHAVSSIDTSATGGCTLSSCRVDGISNPKLYYDADGNMQCVTNASSCDLTAARSYSWTSFDMVETVAAGSNAATVAYTPEHERGVLTGHGASPIYFFNNPAAGVSDEMVSGSPPVWRSYLAPYGHVVAEIFLQNGTVTPYYFVGDQLSSTTVLADANGASKEYDSYDAWGMRRYQNGADAPTGCSSMHPSSLTLRGYTGHEMMDAYCLVNLNARMYDPALGRVLSADPTVPYPLHGQSFNGYSYVENNPMSRFDPSGYTDLCDFEPSDCKKIVLTDGQSSGYSDGIETVVVTADALMQELLQAADHFDVELGIMGLQEISLETSGGPDSPPTPACMSALKAARQNESALTRAQNNWATIAAAAQAANIDPALLASIGVMESGFQDLNQTGGGQGVGVFQLTVNEGSGITADEANNLSFSANYAASTLARNETYLSGRFPDFTPNQLLQATAASYNLGPYNFSGNPNTIDAGSQPSGDYGKTVENLMSCFKQ